MVHQSKSGGHAKQNALSLSPPSRVTMPAATRAHSLKVLPPAPNSGVFVLPRTMAPLASSASTSSSLWAATRSLCRRLPWQGGHHRIAALRSVHGGRANATQGCKEAFVFSGKQSLANRGPDFAYPAAPANTFAVKTRLHSPGPQARLCEAHARDSSQVFHQEWKACIWCRRHQCTKCKGNCRTACRSRFVLGASPWR